MAVIRTATAHWEGSLREGAGRVSFDSSGIGTQDVTWASRSEDPDGRTSPEELLGAAHATCYSMALSHALAEAGTPARFIDTRAEVAFQPGAGITGIILQVSAEVPGMSVDEFMIKAEAAKNDCPVSQALAATHISLHAQLVE